MSIGAHGKIDARKLLEEGLVSRRQVLTSIVAGVAALAVAPRVAAAEGDGGGNFSFPFFPAITSGSYTPENIPDVLDMLVTMEHFAVAAGTANYNGHAQSGISPLLFTLQQTSIVTSLAHADFLESQGARPLTGTFSVPGGLGVSVAALQRKELITTIFVGAYMTAAREFAEQAEPLLVKWAFQAGAQLAEERAAARTLLATQGIAGTIPPVNKAFETDLFLYVRDAYALMSKIGLFGAGPTKFPYPSRDQALAAAGSVAAQVIQKVPNNASASIMNPNAITQGRS